MKKNLNHPYPLQIFVFGNDFSLAEKITKELDNIVPAEHTNRKFEDGESIPHQTETVRGRDVFVIFTSQNGLETDSWLFKYLRFIRSIKAGQPHRITVVIPKLPHQRQDVENRELRQPKMSDFFPDLLKTSGADQIVVCKLHNAASQTSIPPMENIDTTLLIIGHIREHFFDLSKIAIATGDMGGAKYGRKIAEILSVPLIITDKDRDPKTGKSKAMKVYTQGEISSDISTVIFVDDLIASFATMKDAANAVASEHSNIKEFIAIATHADFGESTEANIANSKFSHVWVTDTVPVSTLFLENLSLYEGKKISFLSVSKLIARTIDNLHNGESVSALWTSNGNGQHKTQTQS